MPELPEVQTILNTLSAGKDSVPSLIGQRITGVSLFWEKTLANSSLDEIRFVLPGGTIRDLARRGKFLILILDQGYLVFHLRMSGDLNLQAGLGEPRTSGPLHEHDRFYLHFASGFGLAFNDTRKFGRVWFTNDLETIFPDLGPEPFDPDLDSETFFQMLHQHSRQLKPLLMNQAFIAGMGNIYTDEALFEAQLHPLRTSDSLTREEAARLLASIREVLRLGLEHNGASIDWVYRGGNFQNYFKVYQQTGNPCPRCGQPVGKITVGQRGTHFCPHCQPMPGE